MRMPPQSSAPSLPSPLAARRALPVCAPRWQCAPFWPVHDAPSSDVLPGPNVRGAMRRCGVRDAQLHDAARPYALDALNAMAQAKRVEPPAEQPRRSRTSATRERELRRGTGRQSSPDRGRVALVKLESWG
jgi:hypothetical protein